MFVSVSHVAFSTPVGVSAPLPGDVAALAFDFGGFFFGLRPSARSFSRWVAVAWFPADEVFPARSFAAECGSLLGVECFCVVRRCGRWLCVSVPVSVSAWESVPAAGSALPLLVSPLF